MSRCVVLHWAALFAVFAAFAAVGCAAVQEPPVEVSKRDSLLGIGKILIVANRGSEALEQISFRFENPNGDVKNYDLERLAAGEEIEVGWRKLGGFEVSDQALIEVRAEGYGRALRLRMD